MSGHSKWAQIKRAKGANDVKRGKIFTKLSRAITVAAQEGGGDPDANFVLRMAVDQAKAVNMPAQNIERAIKKGTGELKDGSTITSALYEASAPGGVAVLIESRTDNTNRAYTEIRNLVEGSGGRMVPSGSLSWKFTQRGLVIISPRKVKVTGQFGKADSYEELSSDQVLLDVMGNEGVEDVRSDGAEVEVIVSREQLSRAVNGLSESGYPILVSELTFLPEDRVFLEGEGKDSFLHLLEALEESEEVSSVWHNVVIDSQDE